MTNLWSVNSADNTKGSSWQFAEIDIGSMLGATQGFTLIFGAKPPKGANMYKFKHVTLLGNLWVMGH